MSAKHSTGNGRGVPAVSYIRMSSDKQDASPQQQRDEVAKLAARDGFHLVGEYCDDAISGDATDKRRGFQKMIRDAATGKFKAILCWDVDRFGRFDSVEAGFYIHPLRQAGVKLVTVAQGTVDWTTFAGRLIYNVQQEGKHSFLRDLSRNVQRGKAQRATLGVWMTKAPYGYDLVSERTEQGKLVANHLHFGDSREVGTIRRMFKDYLAGHSVRAIARRLNAEGITTRSGQLWSAKTIREKLTNQVYCGRYCWNVETQGKYHAIRGGQVTADFDTSTTADDWFVIENHHPAIIDQQTFDQVQRRLAERQGRTTPKRDGGEYTFTSLIRCGKCGGSMHGVTIDGVTRYVCSGHDHKGQCDRNAVRQDELLAEVLGAIERRFADPRTVERLRAILCRKVSERAKAEGIDDMRKRLATVDGQMTTARRNMALADGDDLRREYEVVVRELRSERERLAASIQTAQKPAGRDQDDIVQKVTKAVDMVKRLRATMTAAPATKRRELLALLVEKVEVWSERDETACRRPYRMQRGVVHLRQDMWLTEGQDLLLSS